MNFQVTRQSALWTELLTWYDIGIGYAAMLSQSTYAFIDLEQSFGNDNDDTYQINAGVRWTF